MPEPLHIRSLFVREARPGWTVDPHRHLGVYQCYACLAGAMQLREGERLHELAPEEVVLVRPGEERSLAAPRRVTLYIVAIFDVPGIDLEAACGKALRLPGPLRADLHALAGELRAAGDQDSKVLCAALLTRLLVGIKRAALDPAQVPAVSPLNATHHVDVVQRATRYMAANHHRHLSRGEIAKAVGLSEPHLARIMRAAAGTTVLGRLTELRMEEAKRLLVESTLSVTQVALEVGFTSFSHFSRIFRRQVGMAPSDYRRAQGAWFGRI
jgi:AraC-like DNA-binding protein